MLKILTKFFKGIFFHHLIMKIQNLKKINLVILNPMEILILILLLSTLPILIIEKYHILVLNLL